MINQNNSSNQLINYIEKLTKEKLRKKIKNDINIIIFEDINKEFEKLNDENKKFNQWIINNAPDTPCQFRITKPIQNRLHFFKILDERTSYLTKQKEKLNTKIINRVIKMKLCKENIFIKFIKKIKFIIKKIFNKKKNDILVSNNNEIKTGIDVLKYKFNKDEINTTSFKNQSLTINKLNLSKI